jgi:hypothetical protein
MSGGTYDYGDGPSITELAANLWGGPNKQLSTRAELRFGTHGSKSVKPKERIWRDHETGKGGGYIDLYLLVYGELPKAKKHPPIGKVPPGRTLAAPMTT